MANLRTARDYDGREVVLTDAGLDHIRQRHPEMLDKLDVIARTLANPVAVTRSRLLPRGENHYGRYGDRLLVRVSVLYRPTPEGWVGEVTTAHLIGAVDAREEHLWP